MTIDTTNLRWRSIFYIGDTEKAATDSTELMDNVRKWLCQFDRISMDNQTSGAWMELLDSNGIWREIDTDDFKTLRGEVEMSILSHDTFFSWKVIGNEDYSEQIVLVSLDGPGEKPDFAYRLDLSGMTLEDAHSKFRRSVECWIDKNQEVVDANSERIDDGW